MHLAASRALFERDVATLSSELARRRQWVLHSLTYPLIDCSFSAEHRTTLRVRFTCDDWNDLPPSVTLHAADGSLLNSTLTNTSNVFHPQRHPATNEFFVCMRGTREYHTHPSHVTDLWENIKSSSSYSLGGILTQIWHAWEKGKD